MGNDGGSIPTRRELVKHAARNPNTTELKATQHEAQAHAWEYCPLSNRPLVEPIVSDSSGTLYNKDAILEHLLPQDESIPASIAKEKEAVLGGRVKGLRDIVQVLFTTSQDASRDAAKICPITSKELGATTRAVYLVPCGHAFSEAAIRELAGETCTECNEPYDAENVIPILPLSQEDISRLAARAARLKTAGLTHSLKKAPGGKKRKKNAESETVPAAEAKTSGEEKENPETRARREGSPSPAHVRNGTKASTGIKNSSTASLTSKVLEEQEERNKRRKLEMNDNLKTLFSKSKTKYSSAQDDYMTRGFSIPKRA